jgi:hypothetical protein
MFAPEIIAFLLCGWQHVKRAEVITACGAVSVYQFLTGILRHRFRRIHVAIQTAYV